MPGEIVQFSANGHAASGYFARPATVPAPGLIVVQEWWGLVDHIKTVVERFATEGFVTLAPDLYHGKKTRSPDEAGKMLMALNIEQAGKDLKGAADYLIGLDAVNPKKVGVLGFCMGGQLALFAANHYPDAFGAAIDFYGIHPKVKISPETLHVPVLAHFGKRDKSVPEEAARKMAERIRAAGKSFEAHFYEAGHAFFNDTRPEAYDRDAAELAWTRTLAFLRTHLA